MSVDWQMLYGGDGLAITSEMSHDCTLMENTGKTHTDGMASVTEQLTPVEGAREWKWQLLVMFSVNNFNFKVL